MFTEAVCEQVVPRSMSVRLISRWMFSSSNLNMMNLSKHSSNLHALSLAVSKQAISFGKHKRCCPWWWTTWPPYINAMVEGKGGRRVCTDYGNKLDVQSRTLKPNHCVQPNWTRSPMKTTLVHCVIEHDNSQTIKSTLIEHTKKARQKRRKSCHFHCQLDSKFNGALFCASCYQAFWNKLQAKK